MAKKTKQGRQKASLADSPFLALRRETEQHPERRQSLLRKIQGHFGARTFAIFASFNKLESTLYDDDVEALENMLAAEHDGGKLLLIINSPGGNALAAERLVNVCRSYSNGAFEVLVPHMAKSAATMVCFGAATIHMSPTAELGAVDPQVQYTDDAGEKHWVSAAEYVRSYNKLVGAACGGKAKRLEPLLQQLVRYDSRYIERLISHQDLSEDISVRLLKSGMMRRTKVATIRKKIAPFLVQREKSEHGRMINIEEARACGLSVKTIDLQSSAWNWVWELYVRAGWYVDHRCAAIIESPSSSIHR